MLRNRWEHLTVLEILAIAGDATSTAKKSKAMIIREDPKAPNGRVEIALNLQNIVAGRSPDRPLLPNDILYVPGSARKRALHSLETVPLSVVTTAADVRLPSLADRRLEVEFPESDDSERSLRAGR